MHILLDKHTTSVSNYERYIFSLKHYTSRFASWKSKNLKRKLLRSSKKSKPSKRLTISRIMEMLEAKGKLVSDAAVKRFFSEHSEYFNFRCSETER